MAYGLRCRDASGNITVDITDRLTRVIGTFSTGGSDGSFTVNVTGSVWFMVLDDSQYSRTVLAPIVTLSGNTISWTFPSTTYGTRAVTVMYGVY
ncbi:MULTISPECIES: hypothetical protein [unclassified Caballeronia]|uniref:hypothetical protein n=1 Tax=unclassified Caballeronia TaxID=2646786 RepID=UPI002028670F|nr:MULTISPECIES: hypothetical protein [unclassified Caballeronia]MDR5774920.1 hypothetical protein [Caballeronia sp. LZ002]MDR5850356.1 hypothetical protein [Caballeronia sp. LZ003]